MHGHKSSPYIHKYTDTDIKYMHRKLACMYMHTHTHNHTQPHNTQSHVHTLGHAQDCRGHPESHICAHTIQAAHTHTHTHTHTDGSKATGPSLPVACTTRSLGVRGCISGRRELAGRTLVGTDQDSPVVWPPVGMRSWRPAHSRLCSGPAGKPGQLTKPPWSVIEDRGAHVCPYGGAPCSRPSKLSLWLLLSKFCPNSLSPPIVSVPLVDSAVSSM